MPIYYIHFATERDEPPPAMDEMIVVEADSPLAAAQTQYGALVAGESGERAVWVRVVTSCHDNGAVRTMLCAQVSLTPLANNN